MIRLLSAVAVLLVVIATPPIHAGQTISIARAPGVTPADDVTATSVKVAAAKLTSSTVIKGNALDSTDGQLANVLVRLRDARFGRIVETQYTDQSGMFAFKSIQPGTYIVEILGNDESVLAAVQAAAPTGAAATRAHSGKVIQKIAELLPQFVGGSADLHPSTSTYMTAYPPIAPGAFEGRNFHFGIREHGMGSVLNGIALYGGFIPFGATFFVFTDYMRPPIRLASIMDLGVIYVFTHDSIFVGEDGPTHQPIEHLAALRAIPGTSVLRPADGVETAFAWTTALARRKGPTALILTRQKLEPFERSEPLTAEAFARGGYVVSRESGDKPDVVLVATGSEVQVAVAAAKLLAPALSVRVVSMPCRESFAAQPDAIRDSIVPRQAKVAVVEAGIQQGWGDVFGQPLLFLGMNRFGASAPNEALAEHFGFTGDKVAARVREWLAPASPAGKR